MKKIIIFVLMCIVTLTSTCKSIIDIKQKPKATIEKFDIESISLRDITLLFDIGIKNPYPIGLKLDDIKFKFSVEGRQFFKTNTARGLRIKAYKKEISTIRVNLKYTDILKVVRSYQQKTYLNCRVDTEIVIPLPKVPGLQKNISFKHKLTKKIPAIKPTVKLKNFKVTMPSLTEIKKILARQRKNINANSVFGALTNIIKGKEVNESIDIAKLDIPLTVDFDIELKNNTKAKLLFNNLNYNFMVNSSKLIDGQTTSIKSYGSKNILHVNNKFSSRALSGSIINAFKRKKGNYSLTGHTYIQLPKSIKKDPLKLLFNEKGALSIR